MIRENQLDPEQRDFIDLIINSDNNFVFSDKTFQNWQLTVIIAYLIKKCKEIEILIKFPNKLLLSQFESIYTVQKHELMIQNKSVSFALADNKYNADLTIYFLFDNVQRNEADSRFIYFTRKDYIVPNSEQFIYLALHRYRRSLVEAAKKIKKYDFFPVQGSTRIDTAIYLRTHKVEKEEFDFIVTEDEKMKAVNQLSIVLFANNILLLRFINHLFDYAQCDIAEYGFCLNDYNQINNILDNFGLFYVVLDENTDYQKINNICTKTVICTYNAAKHLIVDDERSYFIPQTNRISIGLKRSNELADILVSATPKTLYATSIENCYNPNSINKIFSK